MVAKIKKQNLRNRVDLNLNQIAKIYNPILAGWLNYYGRYYRSGLYPIWRHFNKTLVTWARHKYKRHKGHKIRAIKFIEEIALRQPYLLVHWRNGMTTGFV